MTTDWHSFFDSSASPPSQTEIDERDRTEKQIRNALAAWPAVACRNFQVFVKGSYRSLTNVRRGSDLDVAVELLGATPTDHSFIVNKSFEAANLSDSDLGLVNAPAEFSKARRSFKDDCVDALVDAFGDSMVERHNKCITVSEKSTTLPADVVPCTTHRRYDSSTVYSNGIDITPDRGPKIVNWPQQDYDNGVAKNTRTSKRYKRVVRGLKALETLMADAGCAEVPSWLLECLVYNVPDSEFSSTSNYANVLKALAWLSRELDQTTGKGEWVEVNELKYLFAPTQPWTIGEAATFVATAVALITK